MSGQQDKTFVTLPMTPEMYFASNSVLTSGQTEILRSSPKSMKALVEFINSLKPAPENPSVKNLKVVR